MELILLIGVQGSGKTTFYRERFFDTHVRISRDMVKTRHRERVLVDACLAAKQAFVVDNTNALKATRAEYIALAKAAGFRVTGYYLRTDLRAALERNSRRTAGQAIPPAGVASTFKRLEPPSMSEGFDELRLVDIVDGQGFIVSDCEPVETIAAVSAGDADRETPSIPPPPSPSAQA